MGVMSLSKTMVVVVLQVMILLGQEIGKVSSTLYKVGDLDAWGIPIDAKVYSKWPKSHSFKIEALSPSSAADAPSYQNAFGSIPLSQKSSASSSLISAFSTVAASLACAVVGAIM
ncbi:F1N19.21 [Arabidopsis thaliana]|nr:F1N19.21 [Arabidopsis thaliana]